MEMAVQPGQNEDGKIIDATYNHGEEDKDSSKTTSPPPSKRFCQSLYTSLLIWCGISLGAYFGSYIRVGISYFKVWKTEANFTVMYAQVIGCLIMGVMTQHKTFLNNCSRFHAVLYIAVATGLCGSITTFSSWNMECNKIFFLQWDDSWGNIMGSYNGSRIFEWLICMWTGVAVPISALHLGQHLGALSPRSTDRLKEDKSSPQRQYVLAEVLMIVLYIICTILVIVLPVTLDWVHLTYTATFGAAGAYLRYLLSFLNPKIKDFPLGTFIANVFGSWLIALWTTLAKFEVPYHHHNITAVLYGLSTGFCGCLTTISTFVNELDVLPRKKMYIYGFASFIAAQIGVILIFDIYAYKVVDDDEVMPDTLDFCESYEDICKDLLYHLDCPTEYSIVQGCTDGSDMDSFDGQCLCGTLDASLRMAELLIDAQSKYNVSSCLVPVWPYEYDDYDHPTESYDLCISFENLCQHFLDRIDCPHDQQVSNGCNRGSILDYKGDCECGEMKYSSTRIAELIIDTTLYRRYDLLPYGGYPALEPINYCDAYNKVCDQLMDHVMCPDGHRNVNGCEDLGDPYATWTGQCSCGDDYDIGDDRVAEDILDSLVKPHWWSRMIKANTHDVDKFDGCKSYEALCTYFLDAIGCSEDLRNVNSCDGGIENFLGDCACGEMDVSSDRMRELIFDGSLAQDIIKYVYIPSPVAPYTLVAQSNPYRPLETDNVVK